MYKKIGIYFSKRRTFYFYIGISFFVLFLTLSFFYFKIERLNKLEERIEEVFIFSQATLKKRANKSNFLKKYVDSDAKNFQQKVESLEFLASEAHLLKTLQKHPAYSQDSTLAKRDQLIRNNKLHFEDELSRQSTLIKETEKKQVRPVEMNLDDLTNLLSLFEKETLNKKPQTFFKKFHLTCTPQGTFLIHTQIIQREFYKKS